MDGVEALAEAVETRFGSCYAAETSLWHMKESKRIVEPRNLAK